MKLTIEQTNIINSREDKLVVSAGAGTGKTLVLTERVRTILKRGTDPSKMVCITFTNNAAQEIIMRLGNDYREGMFVGTVHSYANLLLSEHGINTSMARSKNNFDELFNLVMDNQQVIKEVDFLALDEAQDSSPEQFNFILNVINPKGFLIVGDIRQSIYGFNGAKPEIFYSLFNGVSEPDVTPYSLTLNYRNGIGILRYSNWIINKMKNKPDEKIVGLSTSPAPVEKLRLSESIDAVKDDGNYKDWVFLCRSNKAVRILRDMLSQKGIPSDTFKQAEGDLDDLNKKMKENKVKVLTMHSAKGLEWENVVVAEQVWKSEENLRLMYVAVTRAKNRLIMVQG